MNKYLHDGQSATAFYQKMRAEGAALQYEMAYAAVGDEINRLRAENDGLKKLLAQCLPQVRGNRGAWLQFRDDHTHPTALAVADERISECDALLRHVDHALAAKEEG